MDTINFCFKGICAGFQLLESDWLADAEMERDSFRDEGVPAAYEDGAGHAKLGSEEVADGARKGGDGPDGVQLSEDEDRKDGDALLDCQSHESSARAQLDRAPFTAHDVGFVQAAGPDDHVDAASQQTLTVVTVAVDGAEEQGDFADEGDFEQRRGRQHAPGALKVLLELSGAPESALEDDGAVGVARHEILLVAAHVLAAVHLKAAEIRGTGGAVVHQIPYPLAALPSRVLSLSRIEIERQVDDK